LFSRDFEEGRFIYHYQEIFTAWAFRESYWKKKPQNRLARISDMNSDVKQFLRHASETRLFGSRISFQLGFSQAGRWTNTWLGFI